MVRARGGAEHEDITQHPWEPCMFAFLAALLKAPQHPASCAFDFQYDIEIDVEPEEPPKGCGWFDSSHELRAGLMVTEHASSDTLGRELPLDDWLELHLGGWRAPRLA